MPGVLVLKLWWRFRHGGVGQKLASGPLYGHTSNISRIKSQNLNVSHHILQISQPNPFEPGVKLIMKM